MLDATTYLKSMLPALPHPPRSRRLFPLVAGMAVFTLASCAGPTPEAFNARMAGFVGRSEAYLVASLGVPARTHEVEGRRFLQYEDRRIVTYPGDALYGPGFGGFGYGGFGRRRLGPAFGGYFGGGFGPVIETRARDVTFELRGGQGAGFVARGNDCAAPTPMVGLAAS